MTRNVFILLALVVFSLSSRLSFATADSAVLQGLGGAGRAGIPKESLFSNPAAAASLTESVGFVNYTKAKIPDFNAGGRSYTVGMYDGGQETLKGGLAYVRSSRAVLENNRQGYEDRSEFRFTMASPIGKSTQAGAQVRYITKRQGAAETKFFQGDLGLILPLFQDFRAGITYENVVQRAGEKPGTAAVGVNYALGFGIAAYADGTRQMAGANKGDKGYNLGAQTEVVGGFVIRGGKFQDGYRRLKGWSMGAGWVGPRASFDYALRTTGTKNRERDHIFGMTISL